MNLLDATLATRDYLVGDSFTAADLYVGCQLAFGMQFGTIDKRPAFEPYVQRITARPAAEQARKLDDAAMPQQPGATSG